MQELYGRTAEVYQELKLNPPSESVCRCANDVNANGILPELATISNALKYRARLGDTAESKDVDENENDRYTLIWLIITPSPYRISPHSVTDVSLMETKKPFTLNRS